VKKNGLITNRNKYYSFKNFYNDCIKDAFVLYFNKFNNNKYSSYIMTINMKNEFGEDVNPFLLLSEGSTYCLENLRGLSQIEDLKYFSYKDIYISIISPKEVIFLFEKDVPKEDIDLKLNTYVKYLNNASFNMVANCILINERFIKYLTEDTLYFIKNDVSYFNDKKLSNLYKLSEKYEK
jgi:hypothetical protein